MEHIRKTNKKLGVGARGVVYEGYDEESGRFVAVKEIPFFDDGVCAGNGEDMEGENCFLAKESQAIVREIGLMERFEHPNLVAYYGARRSAIGVQIIMEFVNGGSLDALIRRHGSLREGVVRSYTHDILEGLAYLHNTARVCHRDIKPANVLITADGRCKLADFGVSKLLDDNASMMTTVGTPWYMAPEVIDGSVDDHGDYNDMTEDENYGTAKSCSGCLRHSYTTAADIWSLGVTVFEMISGKKPFGNELKNPAAVLFAIASAATTPPRLPNNCEASANLRAFLDLCFLKDTRLRPTAKELLTHQWFLDANTSSAPKSPKNAAFKSFCDRRTSGAGTAWPTLVPSPLSMDMLDTVDLLGGDVRLSTAVVLQERKASALSQLNSDSATVAGRKASGTAGMLTGEVTGGFLSNDGYYLDLFIAEPPEP